MKIHNELPVTKVLSACALTVGTFDGVHRGHQKLVAHLKAAAKDSGIPSAVLTFSDMPYCHFRPDACPQLLTLAEEKEAAFAAENIDHLVIVPFTSEIAEQNYRDFVVDTLVAKLGVKVLLCGPDFALGKSRDGNIDALRSLGKECGYELKVLSEKLVHERKPISSTRVREAVERGEVALASQMLGRPFTVHASVVPGKQLGRTIGFPTINLQPHSRKVIPAHGIYAVRARLDDKSTFMPAALSIGTNPTVDDSDSTKIEFHLIGQKDIPTPLHVEVEFVEWLREEKRFNSIDQLIEQMEGDVERATKVLS